MKITYTINKTRLANMVIAGKDRISTKAKVAEAPTKVKASEVDFEMC